MGNGQMQLSAHATMNYKKREISIYFRVIGWIKTLSGPLPVARTG